MKRQRLSPFILLELLIATALLSILMATLFGFFAHFSALRAKVQRERQQKERFFLLEARLAKLLPKVKPVNDKKEFIFYTAEAEGNEWIGKSLVFVADNGASIQPAFSNQILSRLYLNLQGELCLASWPYDYYGGKKQDHESYPLHFEVLLQDVESLDFTFFYPLDQKERQTYQTAPLDSQGKRLLPNPEIGPYYHEWLMSYAQKLPPFLTLELTLKTGQERQLLFFLPHTLKKLAFAAEEA